MAKQQHKEVPNSESSQVVPTLLHLTDVETHQVITLKLSPGANGLMIYCYPDGQQSGEPLASFQVASYQGDLEILYWNQQTGNEGDPLHHLIAPNILKGSTHE